MINGTFDGVQGTYHDQASMSVSHSLSLKNQIVNEVLDQVTPLFAQNGLPIGALVLWSASTLPPIPDTSTLAFWNFCQGQTFDATDFPELNTLLGGNTLPDYRGRFVRINDSTSSLNPSGASEAIGYSKTTSRTALPQTSFYTALNGSHSHSFSLSLAYYSGDTSSYIEPGSSYWTSYSGSTASNGSHNHIVSSGGDSETTPPYIISEVLIKMRNLVV